MDVIRTAIFAYLVHCTADAVTVESVPPVNDEGFVQTKLNGSVSLSCSAPSTGEELQWFRNGQPVLLGEGNRMQQSWLCVDPVSREDNGAVFLCHLKNNAVLNGSVQLEVTYAPELSGTEELSLEEDSDMTLSCDSRANPPVITVWRRDGQPLDLSEGRYTSTDDGVTARLSVSRLKRALHQGLYTCTATSPALGDSSKSFRITVTEKVMKFPRDAMIAGIVVVVCTALLAVLSRWDKMFKCCKK